MFLKSLAIVILLYQIRVQMQEVNEVCLRSELKNTRSEVSNSFQRLKNAIKNFFKVNLSKIERKRQKIKKAFYRFVNEAFYDKKPGCLLRLSEVEDIESKMSTPELIVYHGYLVETHTVLTSDGYMLSLHRILPALINSTESHKIVILSHGLMGSSIDWILLGPKKALPYLLSEAGYDVWLPNFRGNKYSRAHITKMTGSKEFWNFSWHEIGLFDITAIIEYIRETTEGKSEINFIAYSMSGSALLVLLSSSLRYNEILKSAVLLAPLVYMDNVKGPLQYLLALYKQHMHPDSVFWRETQSEFRLEGLFDTSSIKTFCKDNESLCKNPLLFLGDFDNQLTNQSLRTKIYNNTPAGGSTKTIIHYLQLIQSRQFQMFDLGETKNYEKYGRASPPSYQLNAIKVPLILFNSINDSLSTVLGISKFIFDIRGEIITYLIKNADFTHLDFLWSVSAPELIYFPLLKELQKL